MTYSAVLPTKIKAVKVEDFDPTNVEHIEAFRLMFNEGKQHPVLRFALVPPYPDVRTLMMARVCAQFLKQQ